MSEFDTPPADEPVDEAGTAGHPTDADGPQGAVASPSAPTMQGQVTDGAAPTTVPVSPQGHSWHLVAEGDYAGDEGTLIDSLRQVLGGFGTTSAVFTTSWGDEHDVSNPNV